MTPLYFLIALSRPRFWMYISGPFLLGYLAGAQLPSSLQERYFLLMMLYFLYPVNLFIYGVNDLFDQDTDRYNKKKGQQEVRVQKRQELLIRVALLVCLLLSLLALFSLPNSLSQLFLLLTLLIGTAYSVPPFRLKARPFLDSLSNVFYIFPGIVGYAYWTNSLPPWQISLAGLCWTTAMHLYSAIPDIQPDKKAGLSTTATTLGERNSLILCFVLWSLFALLMITKFQTLFSTLTLLYPVITLFALQHRQKIAEIYWYFPWVNTILGGVTFFILLRFTL